MLKNHGLWNMHMKLSQKKPDIRGPKMGILITRSTHVKPTFFETLYFKIKKKKKL